MTGCNICKAAVNRRAPGLTCAGKCSGMFHLDCVGIDSGVAKSFSLPGASWFCTSCRGSRRSSFCLTSDTPSTEVSNAKLLDMIRSMGVRITSLETKYESFKDSVDFCSDKVSEFEKTLSLSAPNELKMELSSIKSTVDLLVEEFDGLDQYSRRNNLEIQGVPIKAGENILEVLSDIGAAIDCPIAPTDVDISHRLPLRTPRAVQADRVTAPPNSRSADTPTTTHPAIIVKFISKRKRDDFLASSKTKMREDKGSRGIVIPNMARSNVYVNEHLTRKSKETLRQTKLAAKDKGFKYVWTRNCVINVRKNDASRAITIRHLNDVQLKIR